MDIEQIKEQLLSEPDVRTMIAHRAYEIYLHRHHGRRAGNAAEDWLLAESEILPRLIDQIVASNRQVIESHDASSPVAQRAAEHMEREIAREARVAAEQQFEQNAEALAAPAEPSESLVPDAASLAEVVAPVKGAKKPAAKKAASKAAPKKASAKKAPAAKAPAKKPAAKKAAAKAAAKPAAKKGAKKPAAKRAPKGE